MKTRLGCDHDSIRLFANAAVRTPCARAPHVHGRPAPQRKGEADGSGSGREGAVSIPFFAL